MAMHLLEIVGWVGVIAYVTAYALLSLGRLKATQTIYHGLNALGGLSLVVYAQLREDVPNMIVNLAWFSIAVFSIIRISAKKKNKTL